MYIYMYVFLKNKWFRSWNIPPKKDVQFLATEVFGLKLGLPKATKALKSIAEVVAGIKW